MFTAEVGDFWISSVPAGLPDAYDAFRERAALLEEIDLDDQDAGPQCFAAVGRAGTDWPFLIVAQRYTPAGYGFEPGALIVPETSRLFLGAGRRLLAYDLAGPRRLWEDMTELGFWRWARHDDTVLMSAELQLAAWDLESNKLWTTFVEPPWSYEVRGGVLLLDVMGTQSKFPIRAGPTGHREPSS